MKEKLQNAAQYLRQYGLLLFLKRLFNLFHRVVIFESMNLDNYTYNFDGLYSFMVATVDDIEKEKDYNDYWYGKKEAMRRIQDGHCLFFLKEDNRMIFFMWGEKKPTINWLDLHFQMPPDFIYLTGVYTVPECRNRGIAAKIKKEVFHYLKRQGVKHIIGIVDPSNTTVLKMDYQEGWREYQRFHYKRFWFLKYYCVHKYKSEQRKRFITLFKAPKDIWKTFL